VVIAHFIARISISKRAAAAILKFGLHLRFFDFFNSARFSYSVYQFSSKSDDICPFYSIHLNFQYGGGGHLESDRSLPMLHF
jgi:hypothetical protein